jgi:hypothetical protein
MNVGNDEGVDFGGGRRHGLNYCTTSLVSCKNIKSGF